MTTETQPHGMSAKLRSFVSALKRFVMLSPIKVANFFNRVGALWATLVLAPTWFEQFEKYNGLAMSVLGLCLAIQVYALRIAMRRAP